MDEIRLLKNNLSVGLAICVSSSILYILSQGVFPENSKIIFLLFAIILNVLSIIVDSIKNTKTAIHFIAWLAAGLIIGIFFDNWIELILTIALTITLALKNNINPTYYKE